MERGLYQSTDLKRYYVGSCVLHNTVLFTMPMSRNHLVFNCAEVPNDSHWCDDSEHDDEEDVM